MDYKNKKFHYLLYSTDSNATICSSTCYPDSSFFVDDKLVIFENERYRIANYEDMYTIISFKPILYYQSLPKYIQRVIEISNIK